MKKALYGPASGPAGEEAGVPREEAGAFFRSKQNTP